MELRMEKAGIRAMLHRQLLSFFPLEDNEVAQLDSFFDEALARCDKCFSKVKNKYYGHGGVTRFDPLHGCQWAAFLYFQSNSIYRADGSCPICDKLYATGKAMSSADLFYQVDLPDVFTFDHPLGSVMGRASYSNYFSFGQGCTVGNNKGIYPSFGESVFMLSDSKVIGDCKIGSDVIVSAGAYVKDANIPSGSIVFGQSPNLVVKTGKRDYVREHAEKVFRYE